MLLIMKNTKLFLGLLSLVFILASCSNSDDGTIDIGTSDYFIQFKVNGNQKVYNIFDGANLLSNFNFTTTDGDHGSWITTLENSLETEKKTFYSLVGDPNSLETGTTYINSNTSTNGYQPETFMFIYQDENGISYSTFTEDLLVLAHPDAIANASMTYTDVTTSIIMGTFSGTVYDENGNSVQLSEGQFKLKRVD